jgi:hypothetical protein
VTGAALALVACEFGDASSGGASKPDANMPTAESSMTTNEGTRTTASSAGTGIGIPAIDADAPAAVQTATFALG